MFKSYFKIALRSLRWAKAYTALNIFGLTMGLTCICLIAAWCLDELSYDCFYPKHERIFRIVGQVKTGSEKFDQAATSPPIAAALVKDYPEIEDAVRLDIGDYIVRKDDLQFVEDDVLFADQSFFKIFDYKLNIGETSKALKEPYTVVLTESMAQKYFADENPLGKELTLFAYDPGGHGAPYKVTGVLPDPPTNAHFTFKMICSFNTLEAVFPQAATTWWFENNIWTYLLLKKGTDPFILEKKLIQFTDRYMADRMHELNTFYAFWLQPLTSIHLNSNLRDEISASGSMSMIIIFATIGIFILIIACINYTNLATARSLGKAREVSVKKVLGASKAQLLSQFLIESIVVATVSFILALILAKLLQPLFLELSGKQLEQVFSVELLFLITGITLLVGLCSGLYPAFFISRFNSANVLKGNFRTSKIGIFIRKSLVIVQFSIAIILLSGILVVKLQMDFMRSKDLGFDKDGIFLLRVNGFSEVQNNFQPFKDELLAHPGISGVTVSRGSIYSGLGNSHIETIDGQGMPVSSSIYHLQVDPQFINVYKIELLAGRELTTTDSLGSFIINQSAVKAFGWSNPENAIGKPFNNGYPGKVIGVVKDFNFNSLQYAVAPMEFSLTRSNRFSIISLRLTPLNLAETINFIKRTWSKHFPAALLQYAFFDERLENQYHQEKLFGNIFSTFVIVSMIIACLGLLGLTAFAAKQRTKEIGVRKVLGANVAGLVGLLSRDFLKLVLAANFIAWPISLFVMKQWLENFAYRIDLTFWPFLLSGLLALLIALITVSGQAMRAASANPVEALRYE